MANWVADWLARSDLSRYPIVRRARHGVHVRKPSGELVGEFTGAPMHYRDSSGEWLPLDTALRPDGRGFSAPGGRARVLGDGAVLDRASTYWQRAETVGVLAGARFVPLATLPDTGRVDGETYVREAGPFRHVARLHESGVREVLHVDPAWGGCQGRNERLALLSATGGRLTGARFGQPLTLAGERLAGERLAQRRGLVVAPAGWGSGGLDPDFACDKADGHVYGTDGSDYAAARSTADGVDASSTTLRVGQSTYIRVDRGFILFDTSSIADAEVVSAVTLTLTANYNLSTTDFDVQIVKQDWSAQNPLSGGAEAAYDGCLAGAADDSIWRNTSGMGLDTPYTSGALSCPWINKTGYTYYSLRSSRDYAGTQPTNDEWILLYTQSYATEAHRPILAVTSAMPKYRRALMGVGW